MDSLSTEVESSELFHLLADSVGLGSTDDLDNGLNQAQRVPMAVAKKTKQDSAAEAEAKVLTNACIALIYCCDFAVLDYKQRGSRGNYLCSKCKVPKKGHVCPYQPKYVRREKDKGYLNLYIIY